MTIKTHETAENCCLRMHETQKRNKFLFLYIYHANTFLTVAKAIFYIVIQIYPILFSLEQTRAFPTRYQRGQVRNNRYSCEKFYFLESFRRNPTTVISIIGGLASIPCHVSVKVLKQSMDSLFVSQYDFIARNYFHILMIVCQSFVVKLKANPELNVTPMSTLAGISHLEQYRTKYHVC